MSQEDFQNILDAIKRGGRPAFTGHSLSQEQIDEIKTAVNESFDKRYEQITSRYDALSSDEVSKFKDVIKASDSNYIDLVNTRLKPNRVVGCSGKEWFHKHTGCGM